MAERKGHKPKPWSNANTWPFRRTHTPVRVRRPRVQSLGPQSRNYRNFVLPTLTSCQHTKVTNTRSHQNSVKSHWAEIVLEWVISREVRCSMHSFRSSPLLHSFLEPFLLAKWHPFSPKEWYIVQKLCVYRTPETIHRVINNVTHKMPMYAHTSARLQRFWHTDFIR